MPPLTWDERYDLAHRFSPRLVLFPEDQTCARPGKITETIGDYHPRGIELLLARGVLSTGALKPRQPATLDALAACARDDDELILLGKPLPNPDYAWQRYFEILDRARFPLTTYARVQTRSEAHAASRDANAIGKAAPLFPEEVGRPFFKAERAADDDIAIQYWFCYYYDDWANQHEGDWEGICVFARRDGAEYAPVGASYYAHETGKRRHWAEVEKAESDHPRVFVAAGSHASYFQFVSGGYVTTIPGLIIPILGLRLKVDVATTRVDRVPDARACPPLEPRVELLPDPVAPDDPNAPAWQHRKWLAFPGTWGVRLLGGLIYGGPAGPSHKGLKWHNPFAWMERYCTPDYLVY
ncbi:MAG: hypothetical protein AB1817_00865 [Chloroflexota bacterium]